MSQKLIDVLMRSSPAEARQRLNLAARDLDAQVLQLATSLNGQEGDSPERQAVVAYVNARIDEPLGDAGARVPPLNLPPALEGLRQWVGCHYRALQRQYHTPEFLEWARQSINEEEILAALREIETRGVVGIQDLLDGSE